MNKRTIGAQKLPANVIEAIDGYDLLVYIDATHTKKQGPDFVIALAHEFRHVWQYFNAPVVFHSQTPLAFVHQPQETPCELDAERGAKRMLEDLYGVAAASRYLDHELANPPWMNTTPLSGFPATFNRALAQVRVLTGCSGFTIPVFLEIE